MKRCGSTFTSKFALRRHMTLVHLEGNRPYSCEFCHMSFALMQYLQEHMNTHTRDKPFACDQCDRAFRQRGKLSLHKASRHPEVPRRNR